MEQNEHLDASIELTPERHEVPPLINIISSNQINGFDLKDETKQHHRRGSSISLPTSPTVLIKDSKRVSFDVADRDGDESSSTSRVKCQSQPIPKGTLVEGQIRTENRVRGYKIDEEQRRSKFRDRRYDSFKTWSGKLERQITMLRGRQVELDGDEDEESGKRNKQRNENESSGNGIGNGNSMPVDRYYDALEGPELDTLRPQEEIVLPEDKTWPFLLRYPISSFGICLGVSSQAILWKTLSTSPSTKFLHITPLINTILWFISIALIIAIAIIYFLKLIFFFEAVRREYYHPIRINFFFAPWIALLFLAIGVPPSVCDRLPDALWYVLMAPIFCTELKLYGQWMSGGQRRLSRVANPSNHLSVVGNFVGALLGASMGLREGPIFFFAVGLAHYVVLFVTLYQRLPTNATLPKELHPVFFLFVAAPSVASMAWAKLQGSFDVGSRIAYFIAMFLYLSLAVRINFFRGFKFSLAWWAYTFPMTGAAIATIRYSNEVTTIVTQALAVTLTVVSTLTVTALLVSTIVHAFVLRDLFPNDIAIAISETKKKHHHNNIPMKWLHLRNGSSEYFDIEQYLNTAKVLEESNRASTPNNSNNSPV